MGDITWLDLMIVLLIAVGAGILVLIVTWILFSMRTAYRKYLKNRGTEIPNEEDE